MTTDAQCADTRDQEQVPPRALPGGRGGGAGPRRGAQAGNALRREVLEEAVCERLLAALGGEARGRLAADAREAALAEAGDRLWALARQAPLQARGPPTAATPAAGTVSSRRRRGREALGCCDRLRVPLCACTGHEPRRSGSHRMRATQGGEGARPQGRCASRRGSWLRAVARLGGTVIQAPTLHISSGRVCEPSAGAERERAL